MSVSIDILLQFLFLKYLFIAFIFFPYLFIIKVESIILILVLLFAKYVLRNSIYNFLKILFVTNLLK